MFDFTESDAVSLNEKNHLELDDDNPPPYEGHQPRSHAPSDNLSGGAHTDKGERSDSGFDSVKVNVIYNFKKLKQE